MAVRHEDYEVPEPIINSPYEEPQQHWLLQPGEMPRLVPGRREAGYFYRDPKAAVAKDEHSARGEWRELDLVNRIREQVRRWRAEDYPVVSRTTDDLLKYWRREGRQEAGTRLFFAQLEAAETIIFLTEARSDFLQGIEIPMEEMSEDRASEGFSVFKRLACKMATGTGKTTVMGMLAAWSILNKVHNRSDSQFSDTVLIVCPNVTIKNRLQELDPNNGEASLYRTRDLVPPHLMSDLTQGRVIVTNWHAFELHSPNAGGTTGRVIKAGVPKCTVETIRIGEKTTTARGRRYLTKEDFERQVAVGMLTVRSTDTDGQGNITKAEVERLEYVESDTAMVRRILGRQGKQNILVFNDEAHHAYRIRREEAEEETGPEDLFGDEEEAKEDFFKEATVWIDGLDRIHKLRGINVCIDMSATPYYLGRIGQATNETFPWVVSDFGLTDSIESGLVKIPQLAVRDNTGDEIPGYFNIWHWLLPKLTPAERGGRTGNPKPDAVLKWAHTPIMMLAGMWEQVRQEWAKHQDDPRPPVFIVVCKNTKIAKVMYEWLSGEGDVSGAVPFKIEGFLNREGQINTIRVDTKVVQESDTDNAKSDEVKWMRFTLDTVGKLYWPRDGQGRAIYPEGFEELAKKLERPLDPPGKDVRCIVSVGMLTEGWDCNTVTHIIGLRPFMSQLLCEQVVGRGLRRPNYEVGPDGKMTEEVAQILGVPFEIIPFKANKQVITVVQPKRHHVHAVPAKKQFEIKFPRVEGYTQAIRNRITVDREQVPHLRLEPGRIPPEVQLKANLLTNQGRPSLMGPGALVDVTLNPFRKDRRMQELAFELARDLTREYSKQPTCTIPKHILFPQLVRIADWFIRERVYAIPPAKQVDVFLSPYYGWVEERIREAIRPDTEGGEAPEVPKYEASRGPGSTAEVNFQTSRDVREAIHSHLNYVVADTKVWEQSAAYVMDTHPLVEAFAKTDGMGFVIPYFWNGEPHDYHPDFIVRLKGDDEHYLILETKGYDPLAAVKKEAAERWVKAVNADGQYGIWSYTVARKVEEVASCLEADLTTA